jgi:hypothetical protein
MEENRNSGSIGVYFRLCRDQCLRLFAELERLHDSGSDLDDWRVRRNFANWRIRRDFADQCARSDFADQCARSDFADQCARSDFAGNLVFGHQLQ